jgi:hypothetical protein
MGKKAMFVSGLIIGIVGGFVGGYFFCKKGEPEVDIEATERSYEKRVERAKKKTKEVEEELTKAKDTIEMLRQLRKADALNNIPEPKHTVQKLYPEGYPDTEDKIRAYNEKNGIHKDKEFLTEEEWEDDQTTENEKIVIKFHSDGSITNGENGEPMDVELEVGNLVAGMGPEDPVRYIRNNDIDVDYKIMYVE